VARSLTGRRAARRTERSLSVSAYAHNTVPTQYIQAGAIVLLIAGLGAPAVCRRWSSSSIPRQHG
jgi:hypothetical protein